jgi:hypothetical protein
MSNNPGLSRMLLVEHGATAFSTDGRRLAVATCAHAEVWNLETLLSSAWEDGLEDAFLLPFSQAFGVCRATIRFSTNGESLGVANEGTVALYDLRRHAILGAYALPDLAGAAAFAPDLSRAAFVTHDGLLVWEAGRTAAPQAAHGIPVPAFLPGRHVADSAGPGFR